MQYECRIVLIMKGRFLIFISISECLVKRSYIILVIPENVRIERAAIGSIPFFPYFPWIQLNCVFER